MRIVKKTLKGDLLGKTGFKKVGAERGRGPEGAQEGAPVPPAAPQAPPPPPPSPSASKGPEVKTRAQSSLDAIVPRAEDLVIVTDPLHPRHGRTAALANALPAAPPRTMSLEEQQAAAEADADLRATSLGVVASPGGRRGNVAQVKDGGTPVAVPSPSNGKAAAPARAQSQAHAPHTTSASHAAHAQALQQKAQGPLGMSLEGGAVTVARTTLAEALFRQFGQPGSKMQHPRGGSFHIQERFSEGIVRTQHDLLLPLPAGHVAPHTADLVVELEPRGLLVVDIVPSHVQLVDLKARAYDAFQMSRIERCFSVFVYVRCPGSGMAQGQAEAIAHGYDVHFGIDEEHVHSEAKFQAVRNRIVQWLEAASAANRGAR